MSKQEVREQALGDLIKVSIALPPGAHAEMEGLWARPLGMGLFELQSTPLLAYDVHWGDVVACKEDERGRPRVVRVVHRSGHRTLRVLFSEEAGRGSWDMTLTELRGLGASHWQGWSRFYALDVPPASDYEAICYFLWEKEQGGLLQYETGMTRPYPVEASA